MGFGLCAFGYAFLMLEHAGLDVVGYVLLCMGFLGVSSELKAYKGYKLAAYAAGVAAPFALFNLYILIAMVFELPPLPDTLMAIKGVALAVLCVVLSFAHCNATARIAREGGAKVFSLRASATAYLTALYMALKVAGSFFEVDGTIAVIIMVGQYVIPFLNAWLLFTCFTTITTAARAKREEEIIRQESEELVRKKFLKNKSRNESEDDK